MQGLRWIAVGVMLLVTPTTGRAEIIDRILAIVDTQIITLSDVRAAMRFGLVPADVSTDPVGAALQRLIDHRLMLAEADRYAPPEPTETAVTASVAAIEQRFGDTLAFEIALNQTALSREELRRHLRNSLRIDTYLRQRFASAIQGPGDDVEAQRAAFVRQWVEGLRRRGAVQLLYLPPAK
jgi:hypothetical protein